MIEAYYEHGIKTSIEVIKEGAFGGTYFRDKYRWIQPLSELAEVYFRGLYVNFPSFLSPYSKRFRKALLYLGSYRCRPKVDLKSESFYTCNSL